MGLEDGSLMLNFLEKLDKHCYSVLRINLAQSRKNFQALQGMMQGHQCSAVLKADAYGMNALKIASVLLEEGCQAFFVAYLDEGIKLRSIVPKTRAIYVLNDLYPGLEQEYLNHKLTPVLTDQSKVALWQRFAAQQGRPLPVVLHFDTGMTRSGIPAAEQGDVINNMKGLKVELIMSHLACGDEADNDFNQVQLELFAKLSQHFPGVSRSLANSGGMLLGPEYRFEVGRPGIALHGLGLHPWAPEDMQCIASVYTRIYQIQPLKSHQSVGYGCTYTSSRAGRVATLSLGYADGYPKSLSNQGTVKIGAFKAPIVGRVSMDLICVDITDIPEAAVHPGQWVEVIGPNISPVQIMQLASITGYELLLGFGHRLKRIYTA